MRRRRLRDSAAEDSSEMAIDEVEEDGVHDQGGPCTLERVDSATIPFDTAVNACAVSPDGRRLVAVGDTNEVHLYDCGSTYSHVHTFPASNDACFSVDWSATGQKFAVASQGEPLQSEGHRSYFRLTCSYRRICPRIRLPKLAAIWAFLSTAKDSRDHQGDPEWTGRCHSQAQVQSRKSSRQRALSIHRGESGPIPLAF